MSKVIGIDLFCGIGGLTNGLVQSGIEIRAGFDFDSTCQQSYEQNLNRNPKFICADISKLTDNDFLKYFQNLNPDDYKLVCGSPPCQPYSNHQKKKDLDSRSLHKSYGLIKEFLRVIEIVKPDFVIMENVRGLINDLYFQNEFLNYFKQNNYFTSYQVINMADYGVPQNRKRFIFMATNKNITNWSEFNIPQPKVMTVFDKIGELKNS